MFEYFDKLNEDLSHYSSTNDICTPMGCVKEMVDNIPDELWHRGNIKILDPCAGNGNFPAYLETKTDSCNIYANEINKLRLKNLRDYFGERIHIYNNDFLTMDENDKYDLIIANPPYAQLMDDGRRTAKNHTLSRQFIMKALNMLNKDGYLVFIVPDNWMSYADNNPLPELLSNLQIIVLNIWEIKKWFPKVGSSFTYFIIKNAPHNNTPTTIITKDNVEQMIIPAGIPCIPLQYNNIIASIFNKVVFNDLEKYKVLTSSYLHKTTKKKLIAEKQDAAHPYRLIHTPNQTVWSSIPHKWQNGWKVFLPTTTYYKPFRDCNCGMTQSIAFILCKDEEDSIKILQELDLPVYKLIVELTRYGNFNNQRILQHLTKRHLFTLTEEEEQFISDFFLKKT